MKRNFLFLSFLFISSFILNLSSLEAKGGTGVSYYNAGFPEVAKPLLLQELVSDVPNQAVTCFYLGNIYFKGNMQDSASFYFNKGLVADPLNALNAIGLNMLKLKAAPEATGIEIDNLLKAKTNQKNVDLFIAASRAYLVNGLIDKAIVYEEKAKKMKPKYAPVFVLLADIELAQENTGAACSNYELAILYDESCKEAYIKYARAYKNVNAQLSIDMLGKLKVKDPSFSLVDRELADIYYAKNDFNTAAQLYENYLQSGNSNVQDLTKYAMTLFLNKDFEKSLEVANIGLQKAPRNPAFNRLAMWINVDLKRNEVALKAADQFFNRTDKPGFTYLDYRYYGQALRDSKQYDLAIVQFEKALKMDSTKVELWKDISDMYNEKADYNSAISNYNTYLNSLSKDKKTADEIMPLGKLYYSLGTTVTPADTIVKKDTMPVEKDVSIVEKNTIPAKKGNSTGKKDAALVKKDIVTEKKDTIVTVKIDYALIKRNALVKADSVFALIAALEPTGYRGNFWRARTNSTLDPETSLGLAKPYYESTAKLIEEKADPRFNSILVECYSYLGYYSLLQKDNALSLNYWNKIIAINPTNATALKAIDGIEKVMKALKAQKK